MSGQGPVPTMVGNHRVRRAWPRRGRLVLELLDPHGIVTPATRRDGEAIDVGRPGTDRSLPGLAAAVGAEGGPTAVVGHRFGRRAVLHSGDGWLKVVRAATTSSTACRHAAVARAIATSAEGVRVAELEHVDAVAGTLTFAHVAGTPLLRHDDVAAAAQRVGAALSRWQHVPLLAGLARPGLERHGAHREISVLGRWAGNALAHGVIGAAHRRRFVVLVTEAVQALRTIGPRPEALCHRDLHDAQVLVDDELSVGFLDLDTVCIADPALDVGNFVAHLLLAVATGEAEPATANLAGAALLAQCTSPDDAAAVAAYQLAALARLVAVHAFRPSTHDAAMTLLHRPAGDRGVVSGRFAAGSQAP